jgi:hypothetical protein
MVLSIIARGYLVGSVFSNKTNPRSRNASGVFLWGKGKMTVEEYWRWIHENVQ